jgi:uncharacterized protein (DUF488 family)
MGHSTRSLEELVGILSAHGIEHLADVRRFPGSRRLPQFTAEAMEPALAEAGISYGWYSGLGGRRRPDPDSPNLGWRNASFRAYADHMQGEEFASALFELLLVAEGMRTAVMCAEVLWWRCHRRLISDLLVSLGGEVLHIQDAQAPSPHTLTAPAVVTDGVLTYPAIEN